MKVFIFSNDLKGLLLAKKLLCDNISCSIVVKPSKNLDNSFRFRDMNFDYGYHAIEIERNSEFFELISSSGIKIVKSTANRNLFFNNQIFKRNFSLKEIKDPEILKSNIQDEKSNTLKLFYNKYLLTNILKSYEQNKLLKNYFKTSKKDFLINIEPWFVPKELKYEVLCSQSYHFENYINKDRSIAYPKEGGFEEFQKKLREELSQIIEEGHNNKKFNFCPFRKIQFENNPSEKNLFVYPIKLIKSMKDDGINLDFVKNKYLIMTIFIKKKIKVAQTEILVGDNKYFIDRISFPEVLRKKKYINYIQVEKEFTSKIENKIAILKMLKSTTIFFNQHFEKVLISDYDIKFLSINRTDISKSEIIINNYIKMLENKNDSLIVSNRSIHYRNSVDTFIELKNAVYNKIKKFQTL